MPPKIIVPPSIGQTKKYDVNIPGAVETIYQPLYDFQLYDTSAGPTSLTFFALPQGQGITSTVPGRAAGAAVKSLADTNMEAAGAMPSPKNMLVTGIQVVYHPDGLPGTTVDEAAMVVNAFWNDVYEIFRSGYLRFFVGSKDYLVDAPIGKFSNDFRLAGEAAIGGGGNVTATNVAGSVGYACFAGPRYTITPVKLQSNQNFQVSLHWPDAVAVTADGRIGVILDGYLYRLSQ